MLEDQFISSFQLFCDPPPNDPNAVASAVTLGDAGMPSPECPASSELVPGASAAALQHLRCGSASQVTLSGTADGLVNGVPYNVAVASVDTFGNVGPLSPLACQVPQAKPAPEASSGACSFAGTRGAEPGFALMTVGLLGGALARRRRRDRVQRS
jgi:MYXO-CTERM domain-containing protein